MGTTSIQAQQKQLETLRLYASGKTYAQIAEELDISQFTVMHRLKRLRESWNASTTVELCKKMNIECVQDRYAVNRATLSATDSRMHELIRSGLTKSVILERLRLNSEEYKSALRRLKKFYNVKSIKNLRVIDRAS